MRPFRRSGVKAAAPADVQASVDVGVVRQRFNFDWAMHQEDFTEADTYWWWAISIRVDPSEVVAEDEEGNLWLVPFSTDGEDTVTFGAPIRVRETFVPVAASDGQVATQVVARRRQRVLAAELERPTKPDRENTAAASAGPDNEEHHMDPEVLQALARQHGLDPATATEADINAAVIAANTEPAEPAEPEPVAATISDPVAATISDPVAATISDPVAAARVEALEAQNRELIADRDRRAAAETAAATATRVADVGAATQDGRIRPTDHDTWVERVSDPDHGAAHAATLASLPVTVPTVERGTSSTSAKDGNSLKRALSASGLNRNGRQAQGEVIRRG